LPCGAAGQPNRIFPLGEGLNRLQTRRRMLYMRCEHHAIFG
jgi:hypothetical protein